VIEAKAEGREVVQPEEAVAESGATDLLSALRASVEAAKKGRSGGADEKSDGKAKSGSSGKSTAKSGTKPGGKTSAKSKAKSGSGTRKSA
jgi:DNA end-binding protein Ku